MKRIKEYINKYKRKGKLIYIIMKSLQHHITERLILSKNKKTYDITLSLWVRWYTSPISDDLNIIDEKHLVAEDIVSALLGNSNKTLNAQELVEFYDTYKDEPIEDFKEVKAPLKDYPNAADVSFKIGGLKFDYSLTVSFEDYLKKYNEQR